MLKGVKNMSESNAPIYVILSTDHMTPAQADEINRLTYELGRLLESQTEAVQSVSYAAKENLPQGTKVAGELIFAQQIILQVTPIIMPWILGKIDSMIKSFSSAGKQINAKVLVSNREVKITPKTTSYELNKASQQVKALNELSPGGRYALVIGNSHYRDERLSNLNSSIVDAERFAAVLTDPNIGAFTTVETLINKPHEAVEYAIEKFFSNKLREDLLLLYFSGHGIKSRSGQLFLAAEDTSNELLRATGISSNFIKETMSESESQRQILILDCCYGGAIVEGAKSENVVGQSVNSILSFQPSGFGRIIITASEAMQYAFDGKRVEGQTQNSAFTSYLIEGLRTGKADTDNDGLIDINELYQFAYKQVMPRQTPNMSSTSQEGRMFIGLNPSPVIRSAQLPEQILRAMQSEDKFQRQGVIRELSYLLKSPDPSVVLSAETALRKMVNDDSKSVADFAQDVLNQHLRTEAVPLQPAPVQEVALPKSSVTESTSGAIPDKNPVLESATKAVPIPRAPLKKNASLGGFLNVILPGAAQAYAGNWRKAFVTFIITVVLLYVVLNIGDLTICAAALLIEVVYMFVSGRNIIIKYNNKLNSGT
jgi:hypothetical protein